MGADKDDTSFLVTCMFLTPRNMSTNVVQWSMFLNPKTYVFQMQKHVENTRFWDLSGP